MKKILITALAALFMFTACNLEGEEPLEDGMKTPEEFFEEIEIDDAADLVDGWWFLQITLFDKDDHGNYKQEEHLLNSPIVEYYFHLDDGQITDVKMYDIMSSKDWEDVAAADPAGIKINKAERKFSFNVLGTYHCRIIDEDIVQCKKNGIITINLKSEKKVDNGKSLYSGNWFKYHGTELPTLWQPSPDNE